jgi:hypothetical protein
MVGKGALTGRPWEAGDTDQVDAPGNLPSSHLDQRVSDPVNLPGLPQRDAYRACSPGNLPGSHQDYPV